MENNQNKKEIKQYDATNAMFVEYWAKVHNPDMKYAAIQYHKKDDGVFSCVITIPIVNQELHNFGKDLAELVYRSSNEAVEIIEKYVELYPSYYLENKYEGKHLVIIPDSDGNDITITTDEKYSNELYETNANLTKEIKDDLKAIIEKVERIRGSSKLLYLHVVDKRHFSDCDDNKKLMENVQKWIHKMHGNQRLNRSVLIVDDSVVAFGYPPFIDD